MIVLWLVNAFAQIFNTLFLTVMNYSVPNLSAATSYISNYSIPQTLLDFYSLVALFLPMGTISVLMLITVAIVFIKIALTFVHLLSLGLIFNS